MDEPVERLVWLRVSELRAGALSLQFRGRARARPLRYGGAGVRKSPRHEVKKFGVRGSVFGIKTP